MQGAYFLDYPVAFAASASAGYGHVAGTYNATFGLPPFDQLNAALFSASLDPEKSREGSSALNATIAAIKLSAPVSARYTPHGRWRSLWNYVVATVMRLPASYAGVPDWDELVRPAHRPTESRGLSAADVVAAVSHASSWLAETSGLLILGDNVTCPAPHAGPDAGVVACMLEGFQSKMSWNGSQVSLWWRWSLGFTARLYGSAAVQALASDVRMDCTAETAMALSMRRLVVNGKFNMRHARFAAFARPSPSSSGTSSSDDPAPSVDYDMLATALLNFTWLYSDAAQFSESDPAFGLVRYVGVA